MARDDRIRARIEQVRAEAPGRSALRGRGHGLRRTGAGVRVGAVSGVLLLVLMLFPWLGGASAWQLRLVDLLLLVIALAAVALVAVPALGRGAWDPDGTALALTVLGAVAVGVMLTLVLESTGGTVPLVLALFAAAGILGGGLAALRRP